MVHGLPWKTAWITGASSGIGRELALLLARGGVRVAATARDRERLAALAADGPGILPFAADVADLPAVRDVYGAIERELGPVDLAILNAAIWHPMSADAFDAERAVHSMTVNYLGMVAALEPLLAGMIVRRRGHVALVASLAGYRGLPKAAAYAPTKAAVISLAEVLRLDLARHGVRVSVVNPGFVRTPMTSVNTFPMPFLLEPDDAARRIVSGLARGRFEIAFPWQLAVPMKLLRILPYAAFFALAQRLGGKR